MLNDIDAEIEEFMNKSLGQVFTMKELLDTELFTKEEVFSHFDYYKQFFFTPEKARFFNVEAFINDLEKWIKENGELVDENEESDDEYDYTL